MNDDAWADLAGYSRGVFRPRAFWNNGTGSTFFATVGVTVEDREGGTVDGEVLPTSGAPYSEAMNTRRFDGGFVGQTLINGNYLLAARAALADQRHDHRFGENRERDSHRTMFGEVTVRSSVGKHTVVAGAALEHDGYLPTDVPQFEFKLLDSWGLRASGHGARALGLDQWKRAARSP